jgi:hypothetical protein
MQEDTVDNKHTRYNESALLLLLLVVFFVTQQVLYCLTGRLNRQVNGA